MSKPKCQHCQKPVACEEAIEDGTRCPHCNGPICWSVPFGFMGFDGTFTKSQERPSWSVRDDYCGYCRKNFPYQTTVEGFCQECREGKGKKMFERHSAKAKGDGS